MNAELEALESGRRRAAYLVGDRRFDAGSAEFAEAIAAAHAARQRPRCLCLVGGVEMYVARLGDGFIVKRMPDTGSRHAPDCPSYEPPPEVSGLGQVLGSAITEDPATGETTLKLDFAMSKIAGRSTMPTGGGESDSVASGGTKLSLRGLLHYLWDQAELTRWQPGFAGKRTWATVRKHLLRAAENKIARGDSLRSRLYIPEIFSVEERDAINARRMASWSAVTTVSGTAKRLMLLIAELKEIAPSHFGHKAVIKHMPDQAFAVDGPLYARLTRCFEDQLALWSSSESIRMVMGATFEVRRTGLPAITQMSLMPVTAQWLPVEDTFEHQLLGKLVREQRCFVRCLRYNLPTGSRLPTVVLLDAGREALGLWIARGQVDESEPADESQRVAAWRWATAHGVMPPLPSAASTTCEPPRLQPLHDRDARTPSASEGSFTNSAASQAEA